MNFFSREVWAHVEEAARKGRRRGQVPQGSAEGAERSDARQFRVRAADAI